MRETASLSGVLPVVQTPFLPDGRIDLDSLHGEVGWALANGADGITTGMVSEVLRLSSDELGQLTGAVVAAAEGRNVIASCGAESTYDAVARAVKAEALGASALMAIPPLHVGVGTDQLVVYFSAILRSTSIPLVVQDASGYVGKPMGSDVLVRLHDEFGERVYAKPEASPIGPNLSRLRDATGGRVPFLEGTGGIALIDSYRRGIAGTMPAVDLVWAVKAAWAALGSGDDETAYEVIRALTPIVVMQSELDAFVAIEKYLLVRQGVLPHASQRGPVSYVLDDESRAEIDRLFDRLDLIVDRSGLDPRASAAGVDAGRTADQETAPALRS